MRINSVELIIFPRFSFSMKLCNLIQILGWKVIKIGLAIVVKSRTFQNMLFLSVVRVGNRAKRTKNSKFLPIQEPFKAITGSAFIYLFILMWSLVRGKQTLRRTNSLGGGGRPPPTQIMPLNRIEQEKVNSLMWSLG